MARIRTVKPEFWTSEQVVECSPLARLLFIGLMNFCDDAGVHPANPKRLKLEVFPSDDITIAEVTLLVGELIDRDLVSTFDSRDSTYWYVTGWHHQKIKYPTYRFPTPPGHVPNMSPRCPPGVPQGRELNGIELKGTELNQIEEPPTEVCPETCESTSSEPTVMKFDCDGTPKVWNLKQSLVERYVENYPSLDVMQQMRSARMWLDADPTRKKTAGGMQRFLTGWLNRSQNSNRGSPSHPCSQSRHSSSDIIEDF